MSEVIDRPILFSAPMVRAILAGTKTQTRRVAPIVDLNIKQHSDDIVTWGVSFSKPVKGVLGSYSGGTLSDDQARRVIASRFCQYGQPCGRLYVKETFYAWGRWETRYSAKKGRDEWHFIDMTLEAGRQYRYAANMVDNGPRQRGSITPQWWKRPAIFMPRHASQITLEIVSVRVERLNEISEADCIAEGIEGFEYRGERYWRDLMLTDEEASCSPALTSARDSYRSLWESINGAGSWEANPWVWVVEFRRCAEQAAC